MQSIVQRFEKKTGHKVILIFGGSGKHYAQIMHGAPFDAYFSADSLRPELLEKEGIGITNTRFTYAIGKIVLWSPKIDYIDASDQILKKGTFRHIAIAKPKLAPYGKAAEQVLKSLGLWNKLQSRMVRGENIGQTFQFVKSANAELGFVALSQVKVPKIKGSYWLVPENMYSPIKQQAIMLKKSSLTKEFFLFFKSKEVLEIIKAYGYSI
jgi:molybdate transport system substrate-binding protein